MRALLLYLLKVLTCWMLLFLLQQAAFLFFEPIKLAAISSAEILIAFRRALPMDFAAACYLTLPVALFGMIRLATDAKWPVRAIQFWLAIAVVGTVIIHISDIGLFLSWGTKVNHKALSYLAYPKQAWAAASGAQPGQLAVIALAQGAIAWFLFTRFRHDPSLLRSPLWSRIAAVPLVPGMLLVGMRGGVQDDPINRSWSYHSAHPVLNLSAMNGVWNVIVLLAEPPEIAANPYAYMPQEEAERIVKNCALRAAARPCASPMLSGPTCCWCSWRAGQRM
ncbi:MAG: hypothetical protein IPJ85_02820 [Flavobacteriales bacterium]|nr:hypothetical protein [Flavobacteriales bacterium]